MFSITCMLLFLTDFQTFSKKKKKKSAFMQPVKSKIVLAQKVWGIVNLILVSN